MKTRRSILWMVIFGILCTLGSPWLVNAQGGTVLRVEPAAVSVPLGNQVVLELSVIAGVNVNAFDIMLNYDQQRLSLASWVHGGYLANLSCLHEVKQPGVLELACTQVAQPAVSGEGILLKLIFNTLAVGVGDVTLTEAEFADPAGNTLQPQRENSEIIISNDPTYTLTSTNTATLTPTPTTTFDVSPTPTVTVTATHTPSPTVTLTLTGTSTPTLVPTAYSPQPTFPLGTFTPTLTPVVFGTPIPEQERTVTRTQDPEVDATLLTETALGLPMPTSKASTPLVIIEKPPTVVFDAGNVPEATPTEVIGDEETPQTQAGTHWWNILLWILLISGLALMVIFVTALIKRKNRKEDDFLL